MLLKNILGEPRNYLSIILGDSANLREVLMHFAVFLGEPLTQKNENWKTAELVVNPTWRFYKSPRRLGMKRIYT